jgi:hypothetical protein
MTTFTYSKKAVSISLLVLVFCYALKPTTISAQTISFGSSGLVGETVLNPTSLEFGPDDRLYVSQQNGTLWAFTISRDNATTGNGTYTVTNIEEINLIKTGVPNHNDTGIFNPAQQRQVTGIKTAGTMSNPIVYVTSSDYLIGGGGGSDNDSNLDTNSSVLSKLEWSGSEWIKTDLIRGLPRCEENHAINGIEMFQRNGDTYLFITQGGNTNKGAPSNNFAGTPEYFYSAAILIVNLTQLESMPVYTDPRTNTDYVYDLPTLNDPTRTDIDNTHPEFPYPSGHPLYNASIDLGDPFGGNNSLNQAFPEAGSPVQVFSPGYRNAYDVVVTQGGKIYTSDNGGNSGWGGLPKIYDSATDIFLGDETTIIYDPLNHYITNEFNENGSSVIGDSFHFVGEITDANGTYYGGHPNATRAFPSRAKIIAYEDLGGGYTVKSTDDLSTLLVGASGYFNSSFTIGDFPDQPNFGEFLVDEPMGSSKVNILDVIDSSTNGIDEYTATNFGGLMQGNILTASFNGNVNRYVLNAAGDTVVEYDPIFSGFGSIPLDLVAQSDTDVFPGTVWAATYGSNSITVFEPSDLDCIQPGEEGYDPMADNDMDGFTNQDEIDNNTNICSQGSKPDDNDGDSVSDLNDDDDDNDGILDINDAFAIDADNGTTTNLPIDYPFWNNNPGTGMFGLGFTGLMLDPTGNTDYLTQFNESDLSFGGAAGKATVDIVSGGDAFSTNNDQDNAFQFGVNVDINSNAFTIHSKVESPFFGINGSQAEPVDFQSYGISCGNGDQDNYLKVVVMNGLLNNDSEHGLQVVLEDNGVVTSDNKYDISGILSASSINLYITIDPTSNNAQPFYSVDNGQTLLLLGSPITLPVNFLADNSIDEKGLAVSLISTSRSATTPNPFTATWDLIEVYENQNGVLTINPDPLDFGLTPLNNSRRTKYITLNNEGGPTDDIITVTAINTIGADASLFSSTVSLPFNINPGTNVSIPIHFDSDNVLGTKNATLQVTHSGNNSIASSILIGELTDIYTPIVRINAGGPLTLATDSGPDWEANDAGGEAVGDSYVVSSGGSFSIGSIDYSQRDITIPSYIDQTTYESIMKSERGVDITSPPMIFSVSLPIGDYIVNFYGANLYSGTSGPGQRIFSVNMEDERFIDHLDLSGTFGHQIAGLIQNNVSVTDGVLDIELIRELENPLVNAIEILGLQYPLIVVDPIADRVNCELELDDFTVAASGGNPAANLTYAISGEPDGIIIEPTNGLISGVIQSSAITGGPNNDGIHNVTVTVSKPGSLDVSVQFTWTINEDTEIPVITCPMDIVHLVEPGITEDTVTITDPTATDNCTGTITYMGVRSDAMLLTDPYPVGDTTITWTATDVAGNDSLTCDQIVSVNEIVYYTLDLNVSLQGRTDFSGTYSVIFYEIGDLITPVHSLSETADALGQITLSTQIAEGDYKLLVKHPQYLQRLVNLSLTDATPIVVPELLGGDVNDNNIINISDFGIFAGTYNLQSVDPGYDSRADINNSDKVDISDFGIFAGNYNISGETQND